MTDVLLHFKFLEDFFSRTSTEIVRKEHWDSASEYYRYRKKLTHNTEFSFLYNGSLRYEDSEQLLRLNLMREDDGWKRKRTRK